MCALKFDGFSALRVPEPRKWAYTHTRTHAHPRTCARARARQLLSHTFRGVRKRLSLFGVGCTPSRETSSTFQISVGFVQQVHQPRKQACLLSLTGPQKLPTGYHNHVCPGEVDRSAGWWRWYIYIQHGGADNADKLAPGNFFFTAPLLHCDCAQQRLYRDAVRDPFFRFSPISPPLFIQ